jgi:putative endonuclease
MTDDKLIAQYARAIEANLQQAIVDRVRRDVELRKKAERAAKRLAPKIQAPPRMSPSTRDVGGDREAHAAEHLRSLGYTILAQNYRCPPGEIDLVALDGTTLVIVEVRSRANPEHGHAAEMVDWKKQKRVARVARYYLGVERPSYESVRFDVVAITGTKLDHIVDAWRV